MQALLFTVFIQPQSPGALRSFLVVFWNSFLIVFRLVPNRRVVCVIGLKNDPTNFEETETHILSNPSAKFEETTTTTIFLNPSTSRRIARPEVLGMSRKEMCFSS